MHVHSNPTWLIIQTYNYSFVFGPYTRIHKFTGQSVVHLFKANHARLKIIQRNCICGIKPSVLHCTYGCVIHMYICRDTYNYCIAPFGFITTTVCVVYFCIVRTLRGTYILRYIGKYVHVYIMCLVKILTTYNCGYKYWRRLMKRL